MYWWWPWSGADDWNDVLFIIRVVVMVSEDLGRHVVVIIRVFIIRIIVLVSVEEGQHVVVIIRVCVIVGFSADQRQHVVVMK